MMMSPFLLNYQTDNDRPAHWELPTGAEDIVKTIAAIHLLEKLFEPKHLKGTGSHCPLVSIAQQSVDFQAIAELIRQYPSICQESFDFTGKDGKHRRLLPLSMLCTMKPTLEVVQAAYEAFPSGIARREESRGSLPLHYAAAYEAPLEVLQFLVNHSPESLHARLTENISPLDLACYHYNSSRANKNCDREQSSSLATCKNIQFLLTAHPEAARVCCNELNWYPLHSAVMSHAPLENVIKPLYAAYPAAASSLGRGLDSPLHLACKKRNYDEVVAFLVQNTEDHVLNTPDRDGRTPTLLAAIYQTPRVIAMLVDRTHRRTDHRGWNLIHLATVYNSVEAVRFLCERFPEMLSGRTMVCGSTPLHLACRRGGNVDIVKALIEYNPSVQLMRDTEGLTPRELASERLGKFSNLSPVVQYLNEQLAFSQGSP